MAGIKMKMIGLNGLEGKRGENCGGLLNSELNTQE